MKIHTEGRIFIAIGALAAALCFIMYPYYGLIVSAITGFFLFVFRDPERIMPDRENIILSPCDGKIIDISEDVYQGENYLRVSMFLNLSNVQVVRMPISGQITQAIYKCVKSENIATFASVEELIFKIEGDINIFLKQAGHTKVMNRYLSNGAEVKMGDRYGIINFVSNFRWMDFFGHKIEMFLPTNVEINVKKGQTLIGGETILAFFKI